jgi:hypothetical protein
MTLVRGEPYDGRTKCLRYVVIAAILGAVLIGLFEAYEDSFRSWLLEDPAQLRTRAGTVLALLGVLIVVPLLALSAWLWASAWRLPPGAEGRLNQDSHFVVNTAVRHGTSLFRMLAIVLVLSACALIWLLWRVWVVFTGANIGRLI